MAAVDPLSTVGEVELTRRSWGLVVGLAGTLPITVVRAAPETGMIELFVKTLCSVGTFSLRLPATSTVSDLATAIENKKGIAFDLQRLILNQKGLELDRSLAHYNIQQHDTIHLVQKLQGGKPVIYLQSPQDLTATVSLSLSYDWSFSAIYPIAPAVSKYGQEHTEWTVDIKDNGAILHDIRTATDVSYLYWEAQVFLFPKSVSFALIFHTVLPTQVAFVHARRSTPMIPPLSSRRSPRSHPQTRCYSPLPTCPSTWTTLSRR